MSRRRGDPDYWIGVGSRLAEARTNRGLTQEQAAARIGITRSQTIGAWESGRGKLSVADLAALCKLYQVSADHVLALQVPTIPPDHAIVNANIEHAILDTQWRCLEDLERHAIEDLKQEHDENDVVEFDFGYPVPSGYRIVPMREYMRRRDAMRMRLDQLPRRRQEKGREQNGKP